MDHLYLATPFIGIIRLECLQFLLNFDAIDGLHLREPTPPTKLFDHCGYRIENLVGQFLIVHPQSLVSRPTSRSMYDETDRFHLSYAETVYAVGLIKWNLDNASRVSNETGHSAHPSLSPIRTASSLSHQ
jgi:hypothetical protein